ncbi:outer membrane protein transport protein [Vibrio chagasii]|nr:outer membrane protein transport protein [Vibrio chagasii]
MLLTKLMKQQVWYYLSIAPTSKHGDTSGVPADKMNVPLPDTLEFSGWYQLNEQWAFHYSSKWVNWSEFTH